MNSMFNLTIEAKDEGQPRRANTVSNNSLLSEFASPFMCEHKEEKTFEGDFFCYEISANKTNRFS